MSTIQLRIFDQIKERVEFFDAKYSPCMPTQVVNTAFNGMFKTGMFTEDCKIWKQRHEVGKIWVQFNVDLGRAHQELVESTQMAQTTGFQRNNTEVQQDTINVISNITNATIVDKESMASLKKTISRLTEELTKTQ